jgi:hypothetical protein
MLMRNWSHLNYVQHIYYGEGNGVHLYNKKSRFWPINIAYLPGCYSFIFSLALMPLLQHLQQ